MKSNYITHIAFLTCFSFGSLTACSSTRSHSESSERRPASDPKNQKIIDNDSFRALGYYLEYVTLLQRQKEIIARTPRLYYGHYRFNSDTLSNGLAEKSPFIPIIGLLSGLSAHVDPAEVLAQRFFSGSKFLSSTGMTLAVTAVAATTYAASTASSSPLVTGHGGPDNGAVGEFQFIFRHSAQDQAVQKEDADDQAAAKADYIQSLKEYVAEVSHRGQIFFNLHASEEVALRHVLEAKVLAAYESGRPLKIDFLAAVLSLGHEPNAKVSQFLATFNSIKPEDWKSSGLQLNSPAEFYLLLIDVITDLSKRCVAIADPKDPKAAPDTIEIAHWRRRALELTRDLEQFADQLRANQALIK